MPFDLKDLEVTRNCVERSQSPRIGLFVGETSDNVDIYYGNVPVAMGKRRTNGPSTIAKLGPIHSVIIRSRWGTVEK